MKKKMAFTLFLAAFFTVTLFSGNGQTAPMDDKIPIQGKLTDVAGIPLNGPYAITASIYNVDLGGIALCTDSETVTVANGLFVFGMDNCTPTDLSGAEQLYLGIKVGDDPEMTPRQSIFAVPFARGIRANTLGGDIKQPSTNNGLLKAGVYVKSCGNGAGLFAPSIDRSFKNIYTTGITPFPPPTITVIAGAALGQCTIDFSFDVSARYVVATAMSSLQRMVTVVPGADNQKLNFFRFDETGVGANGDITVLVY